MNYEEAKRIAEERGWGGAVGLEMWRELETTYVTSDLTKEQVLFLYWMRTGYYEQLAYAVKKYRLAVEALNNCLKDTNRDSVDNNYIMYDTLADAAIDLKKVQRVAKAVCESDVRFGKEVA